MQALRQSLRRAMHAHGHGHDAPAEPPLFLGLKPGRTREPLELPMQVFMLSGIVLAGLHILAPETRLTEWAKDEAEERERRKEAGEDVEFGHNYFQERVRSELKASVKRS